MHPFRKKTTVALVLAALGGAPATAGAASMCATSGVDLQNKLLIAASNNEFDEIRSASKKARESEGSKAGAAA